MKTPTASSDNTARLFETVSGEQLALLRHEAPVNAVTFSPDGSLLATASSDNTARLFDTATGEQLARLRHEAPVRAVIFSPDGSRLATASSDNTVRLWRVEVSELEKLACRILSRNLTQQEWHQFLGDKHPYEKTCSHLPPGK